MARRLVVLVVVEMEEGLIVSRMFCICHQYMWRAVFGVGAGVSHFVKIGRFSVYGNMCCNFVLFQDVF